MKQPIRFAIVLFAVALSVGGCDKQSAQNTTVQTAPAPTTPVTPPVNVNPPPSSVPQENPNAILQASFTPPPESEIPKNEFGETILLGKNLFVNTQQFAKSYVGNGLNCTNCHLDNGRRADSAPLWAAYGLYPAYRKKTQQVDTIGSRIQGCFRYSMNGKPPALDRKK